MPAPADTDTPEWVLFCTQGACEWYLFATVNNEIDAVAAFHGHLRQFGLHHIEHIHMERKTEELDKIVSEHGRKVDGGTDIPQKLLTLGDNLFRPSDATKAAAIREVTREQDAS